MTSNKLDRRKKYTRMVLKDSLLKLMKEKTLSSITVKEICEIADVNRSTFYAHYTDQYALLTQIENELIDDLNRYLSELNVQEEDEAIHMAERLLTYFATKHEECQTLLNESGDTSFHSKVMDVAQGFIMKSWMDVYEFDKEKLAYISSFIVSGSVQVLKMWMENGMIQSPREMATLINDLVNKGIYSIR